VEGVERIGEGSTSLPSFLRGKKEDRPGPMVEKKRGGDGWGGA